MKTLGEIIGVAVLVFLLLSIGPLLFMVCWNSVAPVFWDAAPKINFIQALCVVIIFRILLGTNVNVRKEDSRG